MIPAHRGCRHGHGLAIASGPSASGSITGLDPVSITCTKSEPTSKSFAYKLTCGPTSYRICWGTNLSAVDLFNKFFTLDVWDLLVVEMKIC